MRRPLVLTFLVVTFAAGLRAQSPDSLLLPGIRLTLACDFDGAMAVFRSYCRTHPHDPAGPFYVAATLQSEMMDAETDLHEEEFFTAVNRSIRLADSLIAAGRVDARLYFHLGNAWSYKGLYEAKRGGLATGILHAHRGVQYLEQALAADSLYEDACLGVGNYKYWSGRYYKFLRWLPWIRDERNLGVRLVRRAIEKGTLSRWVGMSSMGWIEYDRKNYGEGLRLFRQGLAEFPDSRFFRWGEADCLFAGGDYEQAAGRYENLLVSILGDKSQSGYNEAECRYKLMTAYEELGRRTAAETQARAVLAMKTDASVSKRIERQRKAAAEWLDRNRGAAR
jgi:tetratricopeptide (TPR) repeat protein